MNKRRVKTMIAACFSLILLGACARGEDRLPGNPSEGEVEKIFSSSVTRAGSTGSDESIYTMDILVFTRSENAEAGKPDGNALFREQRHAWYNQATKKYSAILRVGEDLDLYFAANARELITHAGLTTGMTIAAANEKLIMTEPSRISLTAANGTSLFGGLPMWGIIPDKDITEIMPYNDLGEVKMLRAVASADISVAAGNFDLVAGHIVYGANRGNLPYTPLYVEPVSPGGLVANAPFVPSGMTTSEEWRYPATGELGGNEIREVFYLYENDRDDTGMAGGDKHYTKIILEGKYNGGATTYYPVAFRNTDETSPGYGKKLPLLRNHKYLITITSVNGDGYESFAEAKEAEEVNLDYEVIEWNENDDKDIIVWGSKFISLPSRNVTLNRDAGSKKKMTITTNFAREDFVMEIEGDPAVTDDFVENERFRAELSGDSIAGDLHTLTFTFTALMDYGNELNPSTLTVVAGGRVKFTITINQTNEQFEEWIDGGNQDTPLDD